MTPLEPGELSAYLDGELSLARMGEIEAMLATDAALASELQRLARSDAAWRAAASSAAFQPAPAAQPQVRSKGFAPGIVAVAMLFAVVTIAVKILGLLSLLLALNITAAILVLIGAAKLASDQMTHSPISTW